MSKKQDKTNSLKPIYFDYNDKEITLLFEGLKPLNFYCPKVTKEEEQTNEKFIAFQQMLNLVKFNEWEKVFQAVRPSVNFNELIKDDFEDVLFQIRNGRVYVDDKFRVNNTLSNKLVGLISDYNRGSKDNSVLNEIKKTAAILNSSLKSINSDVFDSIYDFISSNKVMVTEKGEMVSLFIKLDKDMKHGKHQFKVGEEYSMPANFAKEYPIEVSPNCSKPTNGDQYYRVSVKPEDVVVVSSNFLVVSKLKVSAYKMADPDWED